METKEFKIQVPEGYEIDKKNSTFELIKFKPIKKDMNYDDVARELFYMKQANIIGRDGDVQLCYATTEKNASNPIICTSSKQTEKLIAINKLMNVAKYLNGEWCPNWNDGNECKWTLYIGKQNKIGVDFLCDDVISFVYFKSEEAAQQAIEILGEETIKLALSTDW